MRNVSRVLPVGALLIVATLVMGACASFAGPAWQVNDVSMSVDDFYAAYQASLTTSSSPSTTEADRIETSALAQFMTNEIQKQLLTQGLAEKGITVTDADRTAAQQAFDNQSSQTGTPATPSEEEIEVQAGIAALGRTLASDAADAGLVDLDTLARQLYEDNKDSLVTPGQTCAHFILVPAGDIQNTTTAPTEEQYAAAQAEAATVVTRLATEDFAAVSKEVSAIDDQVPGGDFGCQAISAYPTEVVPIVEALAPGVLSEPTRIEGGYLITRVDSRTADSEPPAYAEVEDQAKQAVLAQLGTKLVSEWLLEKSRTAFVVVDARFGSWDAANAQVVPPDGAASPTVPTTSLSGLDPSAVGSLGGVATTEPTPSGTPAP